MQIKFASVLCALLAAQTVIDSSFFHIVGSVFGHPKERLAACHINALILSHSLLVQHDVFFGIAFRKRDLEHLEHTLEHPPTSSFQLPTGSPLSTGGAPPTAAGVVKHAVAGVVAAIALVFL
ncbi:hypothetical protein K488DRAFT_85128 [Vararia minispora EC-137]|uniref:Uncharacterized protein n=1 Tax=Vararia minispora EC-137 TaxID=1314806 RepID=A0ACB8QNF6_9AGAM|nr:hypothetical protein K488DRAFT_85128 [Vararia minispora EC-137]